MLINKPDDVPPGQVTPENVYLTRRNLLRGAALAASVAATAGLYRYLRPARKSRKGPDGEAVSVPISDEPLTPFYDITHYNNYYEFYLGKEGVAEAAKDFDATRGPNGKPWQVTVEGLCNKPRTFGLEDVEKLAKAEERIYRHRCVEGWSMVIPWLGIPISALLNAVEPRSDARFVQFETIFDPDRMPGQQTGVLSWPYVEGLRMDEAMHPLAILAVGLYGKKLLPQNGAPLRTVIPWKYGFKACKSIVKIRLVSEKPDCSWNLANPREYGFYSNVNPEVDHPRWSQATENRLGEVFPRETLMFNGYASEVAHLYAGMDLVVNF